MKRYVWALCVLLSDCTCGSYPKNIAGAELQGDALSMRISADTLVFARNNLEKILRDKFEVDADGYMKIYLPEGTDSSADKYCDEQNLYASFPGCDYSIRLRDGCMGPGAQNSTGICPPIQLGADNVNFVRRETYRSFVRVKIAQLAQNLTFEMEPPGPVDTGGIHLRVTNLEVDLDAGIYAKIPQLLGVSLGDFTCRYHKQEGAQHAVVINKLDLSMQPRVETVNGKPSLFATTVVRDVDIGGFALDASTINNDPACTGTSSTGIGCATACSAMGTLLGGTSTVANAVLAVLAPVLPYILTPVGNVVLAFLWGDVVELGFALPTNDFVWVPKGVGRSIQMLANAQDGAFKVSQLGAGSVDPTMGMSLPFAMGAFAERSPCVAPTQPPPVNTSIRAPKLDGIVTLTDPKDPTKFIQETYHLGLQISESYLNTVAWAMRDSGMLCAALGSDPGGLLTTGDFVPTAGLLYLLAPPLNKMAPPTAPIFFRTVPGTNAIVKFGAGKDVGVDANGKPIKEPLILLSLLDMGVEFHLYAWDRFVRAFALQIDVAIGLSVHAATGGKLAVSIDSIQVDNVRDVFNELMPGYDFSKITEVLFTVLSSQLNGGQLSFEVPLQQMLKDALGGSATARVLDVRAEGSGNGFISAFVKLCSAEDEADANNYGCYVAPAQPAAREGLVFAAKQVEAHEAYDVSQNPDLVPLRARGLPHGLVTVALDHNVAGNWEYQAAVDSEVYGRFTQRAPDGLLRIENPMLHMLGKHRVHLRAKPAFGPIDLQAPVASFDVWVDPERPRVIINHVAGIRTLTSEDLVTPPERMVFKAFEAGGEDSAAWLTRADAEAELNTLSATAVVLAKDEAGNVSNDPDFTNRDMPHEIHGCGQLGFPAWFAVAFAICLISVKNFVRRRQPR